MNRQLPKWIKVGAILILICVVAGIFIFKPALSQTIDIFSNVNEGLAASAAFEADLNAPLTDHPEGRLVNAIVVDASANFSNEDPLVAIQGDEPDQQTPALTNELQEVASQPAQGEGMFAADMQAELEGINALASVYVLPVADFRSDGQNPDGFFFSFYGGSIYGKDEVASGTCLMAPVYFPDGVTITDLYATVIDNDAAVQISLRLFRLDNYSGDVVEIGNAQTTYEYVNPNLTTIYDATILNPDVSYPTYSYYVGACINDSDIHLYSVRIYYE